MPRAALPAFVQVATERQSGFFLYGVPAEFNLSNPLAQLLALAFFVALTALISFAARGSRASYQGLITIGLLLALADTLKHLPEIIGATGYRSGTPSIVFSIGLIISGLATAVVAGFALRHQHAERPHEAGE